MLRSPLLAIALSAVVSPLWADPPRTAFRSSADTPAVFEFDTGPLRGRLKLDGHFQGLYPLVEAASKSDLTMPPGLFSPYRVFTTGKRFGNAARDWPTTPKLREDGSVEAIWAASKEHPLALGALYRWTTPDTLDLELTVTPEADMPGFELFMSSYFTKGFRAAVYLKPEEATGGTPRFAPVDYKPGLPGGYVMFPRDAKAIAMIQDGRWKIPPSPVDWAVVKWLAAPLVLRRDAATGITAVMMTPPGDCFAVSSPWNPATPEGGGYRSLYLSLFGQDLKAGEPAKARCRLIIGREISDEKAVELYDAYVRQVK